MAVNFFVIRACCAANTLPPHRTTHDLAASMDLSEGELIAAHTGTPHTSPTALH